MARPSENKPRRAAGRQEDVGQVRALQRPCHPLWLRGCPEGLLTFGRGTAIGSSPRRGLGVSTHLLSLHPCTCRVHTG